MLVYAAGCTHADSKLAVGAAPGLQRALASWMERRSQWQSDARCVGPVPHAPFPSPVSGWRMLKASPSSSAPAGCSGWLVTCSNAKQAKKTRV